MPPPAATARPSEAVPDGEVILAVVVGAHGVAGEVKLKVFADDLAAHVRFNGGALNATALRETPNGTIARFAEVRDRTAAEALRGTALHVPRATLPPLADDEYYHADLVGLPVTTIAGEAVGRVVAVENFGAGDVIEIEREGGARFMVPMTRDAVPEWSAAGLVVDPAFVV